MNNKNRYKVIGINQREKHEELILRFIPENDAQRFDELPSEHLDKGGEYYLTFTPVEKEQVKEVTQ